jgi:hypothetical protein
MMGWVWRGVVFLIALAAAAIAWAPAAVFAPQRPGTFEYAQVSGSVWRARFDAARLGPYRVDGIDWRLSFWDLVQGKLVGDATFSGEARGDVRLMANLDGDRRLIAPDLTLDGLPIGGRRLDGVIRVTGFDVAFVDGRCVIGAGRIETDALAKAGGQFGFAFGPLAGDARCDGEVARIALASTAPDAHARLDFELRASGVASWRASIVPGTPDKAATLALLGLTAAEGDFRWLPL